MAHQLITTEDGSHTIKISGQRLTYHSRFGAVTESKHIYIDAGLHYINKKRISILEVGFGTGLNALITLIEAEKNDLQVLYDVVELYPLDNAEVAALNYLSVLNALQYADAFTRMHESGWNVEVGITPHFRLKKVLGDICGVSLRGVYDVIYFDAFDPESQPRLWTTEVFIKMFELTSSGGVLVTYSARREG